VDVLINNAGLYIPSELMNEDERCLERQMQVNVFAPHFLSKFFAAKMIDQGKGHIINICSIASLEPVTRAGSYSISKTALLGLTKALREELRPAGVKVTAVLPGSTSNRFVVRDETFRQIGLFYLRISQNQLLTALK
jgi:3-oxoacyl-[acyl-carrier protein] reductase